MKSNKEYRFKTNPKEKTFHDKFKEMFDQDNRSKDVLSSIIFGWNDDEQNSPKDNLSEREQDICLNLIQWLGSPVGQSFLKKCGFIKKIKNHMENTADKVKDKAKDALIELLFNQIIDLTMMSKIELGDDVISEINRLKQIINK